jgi:hypothetical protein
MNLAISRSTLIRSMHVREIPAAQAPRIIGLDDWAYRKALKFRSVLVDLEKRKSIDLLTDREELCYIF